MLWKEENTSSSKNRGILFFSFCDQGAKHVTEAEYQAKLIKRIRARFPGCVVLLNNPEQQQGIPDLVILYRRRWASLEVKRDAKAAVQPNQDYFVHMLNEMSFAAYIYPENESEVLHALQEAFESPRRTRILVTK
jgi:hypothetical protein